MGSKKFFSKWEEAILREWLEGQNEEGLGLLGLALEMARKEKGGKAYISPLLSFGLPEGLLLPIEGKAEAMGAILPMGFNKAFEWAEGPKGKKCLKPEGRAILRKLASSFPFNSRGIEKGQALFKCPNSLEGKLFLEGLRKFQALPFSINIYGRGKGSQKQSPKHCPEWAIYLKAPLKNGEYSSLNICPQNIRGFNEKFEKPILKAKLEEAQKEAEAQKQRAIEAESQIEELEEAHEEAKASLYRAEASLEGREEEIRRLEAERAYIIAQRNEAEGIAKARLEELEAEAEEKEAMKKENGLLKALLAFYIAKE